MSDWSLGDLLDDIYICIFCGYPIIFRYKPPQVFHLGTGWPCWRKQREEEEGKKEKKGKKKKEGPRYVDIRRKGNTPYDQRQEYVWQAEKLFKPFRDRGDAAPFLDVMMNHLEAERGDVVGDILVFLAHCRDPICHYMICILVNNISWQEFADGMVAEIKEQYRRQKDIERLKLQTIVEKRIHRH